MTIKLFTYPLFFAGAALLFQACGSAESSTPQKVVKAIPAASAPIPVTLTPLKQQQRNQPLVVSGLFSTDDETTLSFKSGGVIAQVLVKEGDFVKKGQLLATLELTEIKAGVAQAQLGVEKAKRDYERAQNLYKDSVATLEQYQNAQTALSLAEQQLKTAQFNLGFSEIRASADGYVLKKFANAGQVVSSGAAVLRTNGAGKSAQWIFKAGVSDKEWAALQLGDKAQIRTDAAPDQQISATLVRKSEGADPLTGAFTLELRAEGAEQQLASGLFGIATLTPSRTTTLWGIPHEALLDANADKGWVFVTRDHKTAHKVAVTIAGLDNQAVYISEGLQAGDALITKGSAYLTDGSPITVLQ